MKGLKKTPFKLNTLHNSVYMKKIGIITFHRADNFGAVLQNYALQQAVMMLGMEAETIDYYSPAIEMPYKIFGSAKPRGLLSHIVKQTVNIILNSHNVIISRRKYKEFRENYLNISREKYDTDTISNAAYDVYIAGSDQIWNKGIIGEEDISAYTLAFAKEHTAAYGASCGSIEYLIDEVESISKIQMITVREQQLFNELKNRGIASKVVCDPVFLLNRDKWKKMIRNMAHAKHKFVFLYYIDEGREQAVLIAKAIAAATKAKIHYPRKYDKASLLNNYGINKFSDGPLDFLNEIDQAEYIVSSSFHGVAFAILMEKEFTVVLHKKTGERAKNLLYSLGLEERIVSDKEDFQKRSPHWKPINYNEVRKKLDEFRKESMECLRKMCEL